MAPALSTNQGEDQFEKVAALAGEALAKKRRHLGVFEESQLRDRVVGYYSLEKVAQRLKQGGWAKIALQFPDELIVDSAIVSQELKARLNEDQEVWILADTSYSPCCVDTIAAEHAVSAHVVHFGDACLNPVQGVSATYVLGRPELDIDLIAEAVLGVLDGVEGPICLMSDAPHTSQLRKLSEKLAEAGLGDNKIVVAELDTLLPALHGNDVQIVDYETHKGDVGICVANRIITGVSCEQSGDEPSELFHQQYDAITQQYNLIHLTTPSDARMLQLATKFANVTYVDPVTAKVSGKRPPNLMKRYKFMHEARSASTVGILLNTLSLANTLSMMNTLVKWIHDAGKKHYLFVVGKPNVAKLANFECVDVWCVVGCGQSGIVIDQFNEYWKPMITPYELWLALADDVQWEGKWVVDFNEVLQADKTDSNNSEENSSISEADYDSEDDAPQFNPVTGKLSLNKPLRQLKHLELELDAEGQNSTSTPGNAVVKALAGQLAVKNTISLAAMHLQDRQWRGLGSDYADDEEAALVEEGRSGIARDYVHDV